MRDSRTGQLRRASAQKKMTVEMVQGKGDGDGQGAFVWPEGQSEEEKGKEKEVEDQRERVRDEYRRRQEPDERFKLEPEDAGGLRERARLLLRGKVRWRPSWEEHGGPTAVAMGREGRGGG